MSKPFSLLIKPASGDCNLACEYCFYQCKWQLYPQTARHRMALPVLEQLISSYLRTPQPQYVFGWQGGEPTLMGLDFFRQVTDLQVRHGARGVSVANGLQTNATLIDDAWAAHLAEYKFLLGVSLDGPAAMHDRYRATRGGQGSHAAVMRGIAALQKHRVEFNILVLVSQANVHRAAEVYRYLKEQGFRYHQYIPCVEFDAAGALQPFAISGEEWGAFLSELYAAWQPTDTRTVSIRHFDSILEFLVTGEAHVCTMNRNCCQYLVVEHNGDLYPCDFFVADALRIGNVMTTPWDAAIEAPVYQAFGARKAEWHAACEACSWLRLCAGDCLKHRWAEQQTAPRTLSHLCAGWQRFYAQAMPGFEALAAEVRRRQEAERRRAATVASHAGGAPGRNEPCPCGSGRKFKHCCGA